MYTLTYMNKGEQETMEIQPTKERTVLDNVLSILEDRSDDPEQLFTLKDSQGFTVATEEDLTND